MRSLIYIVLVICLASLLACTPDITPDITSTQSNQIAISPTLSVPSSSATAVLISSGMSQEANNAAFPIPTQTNESTIVPTCQTTQVVLSDIIQAILAEPNKQAGKEVVIIGYYRGWNLLGEASGRSPVTRSDWVIKDKNGAIYVLAGKGLNTSLLTGSTEDTRILMQVTGIVRITKSKQPYIEPEKIIFLNR